MPDPPLGWRQLGAPLAPSRLASAVAHEQRAVHWAYAALLAVTALVPQSLFSATTSPS